jgi:hypothetical protein
MKVLSIWPYLAKAFCRCSSVSSKTRLRTKAEWGAVLREVVSRHCAKKESRVSTLTVHGFELGLDWGRDLLHRLLDISLGLRNGLLA